MTTSGAVLVLSISRVNRVMSSICLSTEYRRIYCRVIRVVVVVRGRAVGGAQQISNSIRTDICNVEDNTANWCPKIYIYIPKVVRRQSRSG